MIGRVGFLLFCGWLLTASTARAEDAAVSEEFQSDGGRAAESGWVPDLSQKATVLNRLIADRGYPIGSAYVDAFFTPELCGTAATGTDTEFIAQLAHTFLSRSLTDHETAMLGKLLASGYPRRDLTEAIAFRAPARVPAAEFVPLLAALRWETIALLYRDILAWSTGQSFEISSQNGSLLVAIFALYEGADPRRAFADTLLVHVMGAIPEDDSATFMLHVATAVLGRTPTELERERFQKLILKIDRTRASRAPLWVRFRFIERFFQISEAVPRRFLDRLVARCQSAALPTTESSLPSWARSQEKLLEKVHQILPPPPPSTPPYPCSAFNTHLITIGHVGSDAITLGEGCAPNHAYYALDRGARGNGEITKRTAAQVGVTGYCCRLPADDILDPNDYRYESVRCPAGYVATGGRSGVNLDRCDNPSDSNCAVSQRAPDAFIRCTKINERRYQLGKARSGRLWVDTSASAREHLEPIPLANLPLGIRSAVGWRQPLDRLPTGCIGWPIGSLFVEKQGPYCEQHYFRELQYRGSPGDPPRSTPVEMLPVCDDLDLTVPPYPRCVRR